VSSETIRSAFSKQDTVPERLMAIKNNLSTRSKPMTGREESESRVEKESKESDSGTTFKKLDNEESCIKSAMASRRVGGFAIKGF
jgi:hypothetical protein